MAPSADVAKPFGSGTPGLDQKSGLLREPLKLAGVLDQYKHIDLTPAIGREYPDIQLTDLIAAPNADELLRDLSITIARRGVVFFRAQNLSPDEQKELTHRLGVLSGKPADSTLHIHPIANAERDASHQVVDELGNVNRDHEISVISSKLQKDVYDAGIRYRSAKEEIHSDITFETRPADFSSLRVHTLPQSGGDTLWYSGYQLYDDLSPKFQQFLESLTGHFAQPAFNKAADQKGFKLYAGERGAPENVGEHLSADHPIVRTNPVTGWKSVFAIGSHFSHFKDLKRNESDLIKDYLLDHVATNHLAQVRFKWNKNDLAIWDNRSTFHAATPDYFGLGEERGGVRAVGIGERPYLDPNSISRLQELGGKNLI
ncbi:taurine catabolism dioxygenase [Testicularia cyperi]|uniref:Taurine catabolism dioxygenase n=1 Tax=Testicularia cyperi TaxID=1882483 RepID=A0A317XW46_9BASI|nr:taurine catabolism dioxygenase [Testicularia cyperi]